jgi:uncharacterized protein (DUF1499 family)
MKYYQLAIALTLLCLVGCTIAPEKPASGASLPPCGVLPHCVNTEDDSAIAPIPATSTQWQQLKQWLAAQDNWTITTDSGDFVQAVAKTPLMRFRDDVQLRFVEDAGVIQLRSSSRLGISDMGANGRRVEMLRRQVLEQSTAD